MKCLVVGNGGREHTIIWKLSRSPRVKEIYAAGGNGGISHLAKCQDISPTDIKALSSFVIKKNIDLTIVGPEAPLSKGIGDFFRKEGLPIFAPSQKAAQLESSKVFAKEFMREFAIPTAAFSIFNAPEKVLAYLEKNGFSGVIKVDGLAAGKGVFVCHNKEEVSEALNEIFVKKVFGEAGNKIVVEECLKGEEASIILFTDGENILPMLASQDHKQIGEGDQGANTGGMGAIAPTPIINEKLFSQIINQIAKPVISGLRNKDILYQGVLYLGIMLTEEGAKVLEFNVRFGDPETQAILPLLKNDLVEIIEAVISGNLNKIKVNWDSRKALCVVLASRGYPGNYSKGKQIFGLREAGEMKDILVFHAGTKREGDKFFTNGGRVLGVTGIGKTVAEAIGNTYQAVEKINFDGAYFRKDIGQKALVTLPEIHS
ncbi:MAG: phosphoribosylamine--glycine ligase [bacterium (Candidatus Ratteibacteria) CG_4_10_14_3_um_filter_41_18]|uniref:Phosphoribosylamine--glycine ligase n=4 Tax=Candidatus Ratteibacteria TaxID=2979319 RepID=A0A2M7YHB0_9BACT|nr:MAG: phosphoribosylamine--glycine ligase [bacterium (Candidatus Ratteibacteria) CG01_land_8_20_14_3_00_40_19]PIW34286.1 MAG: phosphoribosylamine--glycine ligase [bacterium (Candidatus Ratteibacteria) CG15_BIG_FIL_POST_REV_8_21_14_020_41_12]PIW74025.1 MAG: phosphoribosylamine--glycine ligase [bacterium (Candidatus Ratteibacteria) CG_4_8_14_3_um_filter_41_36]PIX76639.1 MAG: phosphoribosylamine--glycine ligase [bacterium (Candidatus Ratteibacteria) CG_4_10_14_3_um_filter_41_18]PJA62362.1 MAG: p